MAGFMADLNTKTLVIEPEILDIIAELDEFKGAWRALSTLAPERLSALRRVATIESIGSSTRIEGSKLSDQDVEKLLSNVEIRSFETRDEQEVAGYAGVMETIFASWSVLPLTENHVRQIHRVAAVLDEGRAPSRQLQKAGQPRRGFRRKGQERWHCVSDSKPV